MNEAQKRLTLAEKLAKETGAYVSEQFHTGVIPEEKEDESPVTEIDKEAEHRIRNGIREAFPDDGIVGEEHDTEPGTSGFTWYLDPIDGTTNFVWGVPIYAVSISVLDEEDVVAAAVYLPELDMLYTAIRGSGTKRNGKPVTMQDRTHAHGRLLLQTSYRGKDAARAAQLSLLKRRPSVRVLGSGTASMCFLAAGAADGGIYFNQDPHDYLAGSLLIREAGGIARSGSADTYHFNKENQDILFGTPETIERVQEAYKQIEKP